MSHALRFLILMVAGWLQRRLEAQIEYLVAENALYKQRLGGSGLRLTDAQRRHLAIEAKAIGRKDLARIATIASPDTILRWYRRLVAQKIDARLEQDALDGVAANLVPEVEQRASDARVDRRRHDHAICLAPYPYGLKLRAAAAMRLLRAGVDTSVIALWLGHEQVETTQIYLHADLSASRNGRSLERHLLVCDPVDISQAIPSLPFSSRSDYADLIAPTIAQHSCHWTVVGIILRSA